MQLYELYQIKEVLGFIEHIQKHKHFYGTLGSLNLGALCMGLAMGWPSTSFAYLYDRGSDASSGLDESWAESAINAGASVGSLVSIFIGDLYGRRVSFYLSAGTILGFWLFLAASKLNRAMIITAAGVAGLGVGIFFATAVLYVPEISPARSRGRVGTAVFLSGYVGVFMFNLAGNLFEITFILSAMVVFPMLFLVAIHFWIVESPFFLLQQGTVLEAKLSLKHLRDRNSVLDVDDEYKTMEAFFNANAQKPPGKLLLESLCPKSLRPSTLFTIPMLCIGQMLSAYAINDYTERVFEDLFPKTGKLVTSFISVISNLCCLFTIEHFGRKPLLAFTTIASGICCILLALYSLINKENCSTIRLESEHEIFPLVMLSVYYAVYALGLIPVLPVVTGEIFPSRTKTTASAICISLLYFVAFFMERIYQSLHGGISSCQVFALFTMFGSVSLPFAIVLLPETKGKSLLQIQNDLMNIVTV